MVSLLRQFYLSNILPSENLKPEHSNHRKLANNANNIKELLLSKLSMEDKEQYVEIMRSRGLSYSEEVGQFLVDGFILGFLFCEEIEKRRERYEDD